MDTGNPGTALVWFGFLSQAFFYAGQVFLYLCLGWCFCVEYLMGGNPQKHRGMLLPESTRGYYLGIIAMILGWPIVLLGFIYFVCESHVHRLWRQYRRTKR